MKTVSRLFLSLFCVTLLVQFVGCGAADISSAKMYREQRNYVAANKKIEDALKSEPESDEGWFLYIVNLYDLNRFEKIGEVIDTAQLYSVTHRKEIDGYRHNTWIALYNGGVGAYQQNPDSKEQQEAAIGFLNAARKLEPDQPETYSLLGEIHMHAGDTTKAIDSYKEALDQVSSMHEQGISMGLMLKQSPAGVEKAIGGAPAKKQTKWLSGNDSVLIYVYPSKQAYVYFERAPKAPHDWQLSGWRYSPQDLIGMQPLRLSIDMYENVANYYYQNGLKAYEAKNKTEGTKQFDKAIPVLMTLQQLDPGNEYAGTAIPDIYTREERTDKAKQQYEKMLEERPSKAMYVSYGMLMMKSEDWEGAIKAFDKSLEMDPGYEPALYDEAAAYQNWAHSDQTAGKKMKDLEPKLTKSAEFFEKLYAVNKSDFSPVVRIIETYKILDKKDKVAQWLKELESFKGGEAANNPDYWQALGEFYGKANRPDESAEAFKKADQLKHR